jgi:lipoprotein-anchoring transpeptidase ErfK/SrfK
MYKKITNAALFVVLGAALIFAIVKAQTAEGVSVQTGASQATSALQAKIEAQEPTTAASAPVESTTAATSAPTKASAQAAAKNTTTVSKPASKAKASSGSAAESLKQIFQYKDIDPSEVVISIAVDKSEHTLGILADGKLMKTYHVELGDGGSGDKKVSGDHKTPEGTFYITEKSVLSPADYYLGTRWMELSYPNIEDAQRGLASGLISKKTYDSIVSAINMGVTPPQDTPLGGGVGIHGGSIPSFGSNWTWGCVGLANKDVEDFYSYIKVGTKVVISK